MCAQAHTIGGGGGGQVINENVNRGLVKYPPAPPDR